MSAAPLRVAALAVGFTLAGLVGLVAVFDGADTYRDIARADGVDGAVFHAPPNLEWHVDFNGLVSLHQRTLGYVLGDAPELPGFAGTGLPLFDADERSHLADVRTVFAGTKVAFVVGVLIVLASLRWSPSAARPRLVRDAAIAAGAGVGVVAIGAAVAFDPLFLLFHRILFPQGNFLFGPDSNLLVLYPEPYWSGVTVRIGAWFVLLMAALAIVSAATPRLTRR